MQRVLVMGCSGAGKPTFARALAAKLKLPFVSIDQLFWQPGWREPRREDFNAQMIVEAEKPAWVMDGNYMGYGASELRRARADTIFWFDLPRWLCMFSVVSRSVASYGVIRPEMAPGCPEKFDLSFWRYVWTFPEKQRPKFRPFFAPLRDDQRLVTFKTRGQADAFLAQAA